MMFRQGKLNLQFIVTIRKDFQSFSIVSHASNTVDIHCVMEPTPLLDTSALIGGHGQWDHEIEH